MKNFEYAQPRSEREALQLLSDEKKKTFVLGGGTDLLSLMKRLVVTPDRLVNICEIESLKQVTVEADGCTWIGAAVRLDEVLGDKVVNQFPAIAQVIQGISSVQLQSQGTFVGELLRRPECWYFRDGHGLLAGNGRMVVDGDNRYHAILGSQGPAKFVNASRLAPALIAINAYVRVIGPEVDAEQFLKVQDLYRIPRSDFEHENVLVPGQLITHILIPQNTGALSAAYEVRHGEGPDQPLAAAAVCIQLAQGRVQKAKIVLGQVAPMPWLATEAAISLVGNAITEESASTAGWRAVAGAIALSQNEYKIQLAQVAVKRAVLLAAGLETGGLDRPQSSESFLAQQEINLA